MGGVQNVWGEENVPENALSGTFWTPPCKELLVCSVVDFCTGKNRVLTPERGGKRTVPLFSTPPWRPLTSDSWRESSRSHFPSELSQTPGRNSISAPGKLLDLVFRGRYELPAVLRLTPPKIASDGDFLAAGDAQNPAISATDRLRARLRPRWSLRFCDASFVQLRPGRDFFADRRNRPENFYRNELGSAQMLQPSPVF